MKVKNLILVQAMGIRTHAHVNDRAAVAGDAPGQLFLSDARQFCDIANDRLRALLPAIC